MMKVYFFQDIKRIKDKASVSHKERVEKFNTYLDSLSEHYEPAKVSWTK
jgi:protein FAM32A